MFKASISEQDVMQTLGQIEDPDLHRDIVSLGFVRNVKIQGAAVSLEINLTTPACPVKDQMQEQARKLVLALPGVKEAQVTMTAEVRRHPGLPLEGHDGARGQGSRQEGSGRDRRRRQDDGERQEGSPP